MLAGAPGVAVASTSSTGRLPTCAASVSVPATVPNVQVTRHLPVRVRRQLSSTRRFPQRRRRVSVTATPDIALPF